MERISLKAARVNAGLTQSELADMLKVHRNTIASWENNPKSLSIEEAEKICSILKVEMNQIFFG